MTLKTCSCGAVCRTHDSKFLGRLDDLLWFNCPSCHSTFVIGRGFLHMKLILARQRERSSLVFLDRVRRQRLVRAILAPLEERWARERGSGEGGET